MPEKSEKDTCFIPEEKAVGIARREIDNINVSPTSLFLPWKEAAPGRPVLVRTVDKEPSYWLVPVMIRGIIAGFVRILGNGRVLHVGVFYRDRENIEGPAVITGLDSEEVKNRADSLIHQDKSEVRGEPFFVHDGPAGREVWLVEVFREKKPVRWIFIGIDSSYERPAGVRKEDNLF